MLAVLPAAQLRYARRFQRHGGVESAELLVQRDGQVVQRQVARLDFMQPSAADVALDTVRHLVVGEDTDLAVQRHRIGRWRGVCAHGCSIPTGADPPAPTPDATRAPAQSAPPGADEDASRREELPVVLLTRSFKAPRPALT